MKTGSKLVASWGYDQTQYSIYTVVREKGRFAWVKGENSWSSLDDSDLAEGSTVKLYKVTQWDDLSEAERKDWSSRGFDDWSYRKHMTDGAIEAAPELTIVKMSRVNGDRYSHLWELSDGSTHNSEEDWHTKKNVKIVQGLKKCLVQTSKYNGQEYVKIDDVITAYHDPEFERNNRKYEEQNEYTAYNGR